MNGTLPLRLRGGLRAVNAALANATIPFMLAHRPGASGVRNDASAEQAERPYRTADLLRSGQALRLMFVAQLALRTKRPAC
jgi:hypothetical protein